MTAVDYTRLGLIGILALAALVLTIMLAIKRNR